MSLRSLLMPAVSGWLLGPARQSRQRERFERRRQARGEPHRLLYFHQPDDPYSALAAGVLAPLLARHEVQLVAHVVGPPPDSAAPERERLVAWSRLDAQRLAMRHGLDWRDPGAQPPAESVEIATQALVRAADEGRFAQDAPGICARLWQGGQAPDALTGQTLAPAQGQTPEAVQAHLARAQRLRESLGHYLGATFHYGGEWYWGIDRLHHLEARLQSLGAQRAGVSGALFAPPADLDRPVPLPDPPPIDFYFSLRSPYSAIVAQRVFALSRLTGAPVRLKYLLPMVMRGLPVPAAKRRYISLDAAREARARGIDFGRVNDPVGRPAERGLALMPLAERLGLGQAYVLSFMRGVWAEGIDAGSDGGLRRIAERAGMSWAQAREALADEGWRAAAERHRQELFSLGLWGVPSFRVGDVAAWGQDRLWVMEQALTQRQVQAQDTAHSAPGSSPT